MKKNKVGYWKFVRRVWPIKDYVIGTVVYVATSIFLAITTEWWIGLIVLLGSVAAMLLGFYNQYSWFKNQGYIEE